uniref:C2H2-type domain-containing protein n=1 Tax=Octopus bimaculoides TaxID=37653 RepID=A0A0L8GDL6_OCTBM
MSRQKKIMENELRTRLLKQQRKPYYCDIFAKPFSETCLNKYAFVLARDYHCDMCGKSIFMDSHLTTTKHIHIGKKLYL